MWRTRVGYAGGTKPGMRCVRHGDWKLIQYDVLDGSVRKTQLFDLKTNPHELLEQHAVDVVRALTHNEPQRGQVDLADDPRFAQQRAHLEALLLAVLEDRLAGRQRGDIAVDALDEPLSPCR